MSRYRSGQSQSHHKQTQKSKTKSGKTIQVGRDFTQKTNTRIGLWISVVFVFAAGASILISIFGEHIPGIEIQINESLPAEIFNKSSEN